MINATLTFILFVGKSEAERIPAMLQTLNRWSPHVTTSFRQLPSEGELMNGETTDCVEPCYFQASCLDKPTDLSELVPEADFFFHLQPDNLN